MSKSFSLFSDAQPNTYSQGNEIKNIESFSLGSNKNPTDHSIHNCEQQNNNLNFENIDKEGLCSNFSASNKNSNILSKGNENKNTESFRNGSSGISKNPMISDFQQENILEFVNVPQERILFNNSASRYNNIDIHDPIHANESNTNNNKEMIIETNYPKNSHLDNSQICNYMNFSVILIKLID